MRPETQEDEHSLIIVADEEESLVAIIMRATPIINVNELCIVDFVDLKVGGQSKLFSGKRDREHFIYEGITFLHIPMLNTNEAFACLHYRPLVAGAWTERKKIFHGGSFLKLADDDV